MGISAQASRGSKPTSVLAGEPAHEQSPGASLRTATSGGEKLIQPAHPSRARTRRGPHPPSQGLRPFKPPVQKLSQQPGLAPARDARARPDRLDPAAVPHRPGTLLGAQTTATPAATPIRTDRPPRPPHDPAPRQRLGVVRTARRRVRAPASPPSPARLTAQRLRRRPDDHPRGTPRRQPAHKQRHITGRQPRTPPDRPKPPSATPIQATTGSTGAIGPAQPGYCKPANSSATARSGSTRQASLAAPGA